MIQHSISMFLNLALLALVLTFWCSQCLACLPEGSDGKVVIGQKTAVCLVFNDKDVLIFQPTADQFSRLAINKSFKEAISCSTFYFPQGCSPSTSIPTSSPEIEDLSLAPTEAPTQFPLLSPSFSPSPSPVSTPFPNVSLSSNGEAFVEAEDRGNIRVASSSKRRLESNECEPSLFYGESMGVKAIYKKMYASCPPSSPAARFIPIVTLVIQVDFGEVQSLIWDDGCFSTCSQNPDASNSCVNNAFDLSNNQPLQTSQDVGEDCGRTGDSCSEDGECDLNVYVVWTGRDANGNYFASAGRRFSIFTQYGLPDVTAAFQSL